MKCKNLLIFLIFFKIFIISSNCIEVLNSTLYQKSINILGVEYNYAIADIELSDDLYLYDWVSCPSFQCPTIARGIDCTCDYTDAQNCPKLLDPFCNRVCNPFMCNSTNKDIKDWKVLKLDTLETHSTDKVMEFRYKANFSDCYGLSLKLNSIEGYGAVSFGAVSYPDFNKYFYISSSSFQKDIHFNVCPSENINTTYTFALLEYWTYDTYFIQVKPLDDQVFKFSIKLESIKINQNLPGEDCTPYTLPEFYECVPLNKQYTTQYSMGNQRNYLFEVKKPDYYFFNFVQSDGNYRVYISNVQNDVFPKEGNYTWEAVGGKSLLLYLEPIDENTPLRLFISFYTDYFYTMTSFSINNYSQKSLYPISSLPSAQAGYLNLLETSRLVLPNGENYITRSDSPFSILYPQYNLNPIWPPPFSTFNYSSKIKNQVLQFSLFKPKSYQVAFLLDDGPNKNQDFETILNSKLLFEPNIFDKNGKVIKLQVGFKSGEIKECDYKKFQNITQEIYNIKNKLLITNQLDTVRNSLFNLAILVSDNSYIGCYNYMKSRYFSSEVINTTVVSRGCTLRKNDPMFSKDPCCNDISGYYQCCNAREINVNSTVLKDIKSDLVKKESSSFECTVSVLNEFNRTLSSINSGGSSGCSISEYQVEKASFDIVNAIRDCKSVTKAPYCTLDSDCNNYGLKKCNLYQRKCIMDMKIVDKSYIKCVLNTISVDARYYLLNGTSSFNDSTIEILYNQHLITDCVGSLSIMDRSLYRFNLGLYSIANRCYENPLSLDTTGLIYHDVCIDVGGTEFSYIYNSNVDTCGSMGFCPQLGGCGDSTCLLRCSLYNQFCGYCSTSHNNTECHRFTEYQNSLVCNNKDSVCILANGEYYTNLTKSECENIGSCSHSCGVKCTSEIAGVDSVCFNFRVNETYCQENSGTWRNDGFCYFSAIANEQDCSLIKDASWVDCASKVYGECAGPSKYINVCQINNIKCKTKEECLNAGECSDQFYFNPSENKVALKNGLGLCLFNHTLIDGKIMCNYNSNDSPEGCYVKEYGNTYTLSKSNCETKGGRWWVPAKNMQECIERKGCRVLDSTSTQIPPFNYNWNEMNEEQCTSCDIETFREWKSKYSWEKATWLSGISVKPEWITKDFVYNQLKVNGVFSYDGFYASLKAAGEYQKNELYFSEALCRIDRIQTSLNTLACSFLGSQNEENNDTNSNGSACFESSTPIIGQVKICSELKSEASFDFGKMEFGLGSIDQNCQTLLIYQITKEIYNSIVPQSLASNFAAYNQHENYAVYNEKKASIGSLLSDGIKIHTNQKINKVNICFKELSAFNDKYPKLDIAIQIDNKSLPIPLGLELLETRNSSNNYFYCAQVPTIPMGDPIFFAINRLENWDTVEKELFDKDTKNLMLVLATIFLLVAVFGFLEIGTIIFKKVMFKSGSAFKLIQILIVFITTFITIRSIYFFLLAQGKLYDSSVADYILVVLPTFIYFTAFTILVSVWYVVTSLVQSTTSTSSIFKRLYKIIISVNIVLYLFFISIVLVFQYTEKKVVNDCGSRIFIPNTASSAQKAISLAYAIVQAALSLIISVAFVYFGIKLYARLKNNKNQDKIFKLSIICGVCFLIHCAFVIVLVTNINSMTFSFIGLVISEIFPALSILYFFNPLKKDKLEPNNKSNNSNNKANNKIKSKNIKNSKNSNNSNNSDSNSSSNNNSGNIELNQLN